MSEREDVEILDGVDAPWVAMLAGHLPRAVVVDGLSSIWCSCGEPLYVGHLVGLITARLAAHDERVRAEALAPVRALAQEMSGDDCECERYWTRRLTRALPPERLAGEAGAG